MDGYWHSTLNSEPALFNLRYEPGQDQRSEYKPCYEQKQIDLSHHSRDAQRDKNPEKVKALPCRVRQTVFEFHYMECDGLPSLLNLTTLVVKQINQ